MHICQVGWCSVAETIEQGSTRLIRSPADAARRRLLQFPCFRTWLFFVKRYSLRLTGKQTPNNGARSMLKRYQKRFCKFLFRRCCASSLLWNLCKVFVQGAQALGGLWARSLFSSEVSVQDLTGLLTRSLHKLSVKGLLAISMQETSWQHLHNRSLGKISVRGLLARSLYKISLRALWARTV